MALEQAQEKSWTRRPRVPRKLVGLFAGLVIAGTLLFLLGLRVDPLRSWQSYLVNFLFWGGLAQGAVVFAAIYNVVGAKWGPSPRRCAEGMVVFLPVNLALFFPLYFALERFFATVREINPARGAWFDPRFIFVRGGLGIALMTVLSLLFVYYSLRPEVGWGRARRLSPRSRLFDWITEGWEGDRIEQTRCQRGTDVLAAGVLLAYPLTYTFMAFDLIMALDPFWYSSLFGGYYFISSFYLGLAGIGVVSVLIHRQLGAAVATPAQFSDLGRLLLGFNLTYLAMVWSQYIVIWYGNLPEETHFIIVRLWKMPWAPLSWAVLVLSVLFPFLIFLSRRAKHVPMLIFAVSLSIALGLWLERYVLVVPSLWSDAWMPLGWIELGVTAAFFGAAGLSYLFFLSTFPVIPFPSAAVSSPLSEEKESERNVVRA